VLSLTQLATKLHSEKTTVFRLAATLVERGWLTKDESLRYRLGPNALSLAAGDHGAGDIKTSLEPIMAELQEETQETIHLTRLEGRQVVYLAQLVSPKPVLSFTVIGSRSPAHCVSSGLAQLAALPDKRLDWVLSAPLKRYTDASLTDPAEVREEIARTRERGYGINIGGYRNEVGGIGVAVCIPVFRLMKQDFEALGARLIRAARDAEAILRERPATTSGNPILRDTESEAFL
jgi:DNA-binding IclR family transcriptional regulator